MSTAEASTIVTGVDFVSVPTQDLERAAEFETGTVTLSVVNPEKMGIGEFRPNANHLALHVEDVEAARATLEERGVTTGTPRACRKTAPSAGGRRSRRRGRA